MFVDLHNHLGGSVSTHALWKIANDEGYVIATKSFEEFEKRVSLGTRTNKDLNDLKKFYEVTEKIQSSLYAVYQSVLKSCQLAYDSYHVNLLELRFNPLFRNRKGTLDLDAIIRSAIRGIEDAQSTLQGFRGGLILMMDKNLSKTDNIKVINKAIKYAGKLVIGVDIGGSANKEFRFDEDYVKMFGEARKAGLGITIHSGETRDSKEEVEYVLEKIRPDRIGHGLRIVDINEKVLEKIRENYDYNLPTIEICPSSNLKNSMVEDVSELRRIISVLRDNGFKLTINTDGSEIYGTSIKKEFRLIDATEDEIKIMTDNARNATFIL